MTMLGLCFILVSIYHWNEVFFSYFFWKVSDLIIFGKAMLVFDTTYFKFVAEKKYFISLPKY